MRQTFVFAWLALLFTAIAGFFWYNDLVYRLPTPVPTAYNPIAIGSKVPAPGTNLLSGSNFPIVSANITPGVNLNKPVFLHFFNPDCPCSRFNIKHVRSLVKQYGTEVDFKIVLVTTKDYSPQQIQERFDIDVPILKDEDLSSAYGVYSTPQAVIINKNSELHYRGNYNRSRYCTDKKTNYAEMALVNLLNHRSTGEFENLALKAYGCELPGCRKPE